MWVALSGPRLSQRTAFKKFGMIHANLPIFMKGGVLDAKGASGTAGDGRRRTN